ncbi:YkvA family protein [Microcella sp.]|uniref:YkvA family protein n=1 Tax=Microcella sp. TaxID=1913979 RepID=UPI003F7090AC
MSRGRAIFSAVLVALGALAYGASPIDLIPELLTGPLGLTDDLAVWIGAGYAIWKLLSGSQPSPGTPPPPPAAEPPRWEQRPPE